VKGVYLLCTIGKGETADRAFAAAVKTFHDRYGSLPAQVQISVRADGQTSAVIEDLARKVGMETERLPYILPRDFALGPVPDGRRP